MSNTCLIGLQKENGDTSKLQGPKVKKTDSMIFVFKYSCSARFHKSVVAMETSDSTTNTELQTSCKPRRTRHARKR